MATGFITRHCSALALALAAWPALALDVSLIGTFGEKAAVLVIDGGAPKTLRIGQQAAGVTLVSVQRDRAVIEIEGNRRTLERGQHYISTAADDPRQSVTLAADTRGHFITEGAINGGPVRFVIDTGVTVIALPASDAVRLGLDYRKGQVAVTKTAAGLVQVYRIRLDSVRVGAIELTAVEGIVIEQGLDIALLGMSFLNRVEMRNEGQVMTLTRRY
ncbi:MAG: TIGR02281 family clan AA aspartic protease [Proteobacteria bacterium]|nr:TIGR02281 family clan AA aspartic protease [Pseudomonadota bacterium]